MGLRSHRPKASGSHIDLRDERIQEALGRICEVVSAQYADAEYVSYIGLNPLGVYLEVYTEANDFDGILKVLSEQLGDLSVGPRSQRAYAQPQCASAINVLRKDTEQAHIVFGTSTMSSSDPDRFALYLMNGVLGGGMSSRLFQEIREKRGLVYSVGSTPILFQDSGEFAMFAGSRPENAHTVLELMVEETARMANDGATAQELDRARQAVMGQQVLGMESTSARMRRLGKGEVTDSEILSTDEVIERFEAVTIDDVKRIAEQVLSAPKVLSVVSPLAEGEFEKYIQ